MRPRVLLIAPSAMIAASLLNILPARSSDETERVQLEKSWVEACERFDDQTDARRDCNSVWFREHEKAVWQLNLNPHGRAAVAPPS